jgi:death-on-curing protein
MPGLGRFAGATVSTFRFLEWDELIQLHEDELRRYGGQAGFIDENAVRSVFARPQFTAQYVQDADLADLAADYLYGFCTTQGFSDGNKRTAFVAAERFLRLNDWRTTFSYQLMYLITMAVARNELDRDDLAEILRDHLEPMPPSSE